MINKLPKTFKFTVGVLPFLAVSAFIPLFSANAKPAPEVVFDQTYKKPGAGLEFTTDYDGFTKPGQLETFHIFVRDHYEEGTMRIRMNSSNSQNLSISAPGEYGIYSMEGGDDHRIVINVSSEIPGRYYVNVEAEATDAYGQRVTDIYTMAIQVGDGQPSMKPAHGFKLEKPRQTNR